MNISRITIDRLYNKGNYEHVKYSVTVELKEGEKASTAFRNCSRILVELNPKQPVSTETYKAAKVWQGWTVDEKSKEILRRGYSDKLAERVETGDKQQIEIIETYDKWAARREKAMALFDNIGGTVEYTDAKYDWDDGDWQD